jgi:5-methylcytosine-specific restriction protein A
MPSVPKQTTCIELGCNNARSRRNVYCLQHGGNDALYYKSNDTPKRKQFNAMYNTKQWASLRMAQLSKYPICAGCESEGIITPANTVDHLFPWSQHGRESFYLNVFQSLCVIHHTYKTQLEQRGVYRRYGTPVRDYMQGDYERLFGGGF